MLRQGLRAIEKPADDDDDGAFEVHPEASSAIDRAEEAIRGLATSKEARVAEWPSPRRNC